MSRLDEIKARCAAATEGPWVRDMHSPDMSGRSGWYIRGPRKLGLRSMVLNSRMLPGDAEFIEHAREDVPWLIERIGELNGAICWDTTCLNCSSLLDSNYDQYMRAEIAEAEVARLTAELAEVKRTYTPCDLDLLTERDALAAQVTRVESLAGQWERLAETAINPDSREWLQACAATLRECLSGWQKMHAALAGSEADTTDTQPTDPGCGCSTNPARARYADGDPAGCYCTCSDDAREGCEHEPDGPQPTDQEDQ